MVEQHPVETALLEVLQVAAVAVHTLEHLGPVAQENVR